MGTLGNDESGMPVPAFKNWVEAYFMEILSSGSEACSNIQRTEGERYGLTIATFKPLSCFGQVDYLT